MSSAANTDRHVAAAFVAVLVVAAGAGIAIASLSWQVSVLALIAAVAILGLIVLRLVVAPQARSVLPAQEDLGETAALRPARLVYYLGVVTIGFLTVRPALGFAASDWIFLAALGLAALAIVVHGVHPHYLIPGTITAGVMIFALGGFVSSTQALLPYASAFIVIRMLYLTVIWFWLGSLLLETRAHVENAVLLWVISVALSSAGAVAQFFYGDVIPGGEVSYGRMTGFTEHFNTLGGLAAGAFVPALMLAVDSRRGRVRLVGLASTGLIAAGLLLSGSVGGLLAASVGAMVWLALRGVSVRIVIGAAVVVACGLVLMSGSRATDAPSPVDRIERVTSGERRDEGTGGTIYTRIEGYSLAWDRIADQPFVGVGLDPETSDVVLEDHSVHNLILGPWFTAGLLGVVGMVLMLAGALVTGFRVLRASAPENRPFDAALLAALVAFVQHGMGEPILFVRYGWLPTALLIALRVQHVRARGGAQARSQLGQPLSSRPVSYGLPSSR